MAKKAAEVAREKLGIHGWRSGQRKSIEAALLGKDSVVCLPTGAGKSLCFQAVAMAEDCTVLVISPLIALMEDQVRGCNDEIMT